MAEREEELKSFLMRIKEKSEKTGLKLNIKKLRSWHPVPNRWGRSGNSDRLYFLGLQNHRDGDCSHEIKRHLLLERKVMTNLDNILKSRDFSLLKKFK